MRMMAIGLKPMLEQLGELMDPQLVDAIGRAGGITAEMLTEGAQQRLELQARARAFFERYDLLLTPTMAVEPFEVGIHSPQRVAGRHVEGMQWTPFTFPFNATGHPAISVPAGQTAAGLPVGLQIVGRWRRDELVLRAAHAFESASPWPRIVELT
jgi:aspartyl-tRNA(Asn)/glutamyl-tRNA(Gln) amidotransferase subunit A